MERRTCGEKTPFRLFVRKCLATAAIAPLCSPVFVTVESPDAQLQATVLTHPLPTFGESLLPHAAQTTVLSLDTPGQEPRYSDREMVRSVMEADKAIEYTTDGEFSIADSEPDIVHVAASPDHVRDKTNERCVEVDQIMKQHDDLRTVRELGKAAEVMIVMNGAPFCMDVGGFARATQYFPTAYHDYSAAIYNTFDARVIAHETGHEYGLGHDMNFSCSSPNKGVDNRTNINKEDVLDIADQIAIGCGPDKNYDGNPEIYSSFKSVMGRAGPRSGNNPSMIYTPIQLEAMDAQRFKIEEVSTRPERHYVSYEKGSSIGVRIRLPDGHPLKKADPNIDALSFGLRMNPNNAEDPSITNSKNEGEILIMAQGTGVTYEIDTLLFGQLVDSDTNNIPLSNLSRDSSGMYDQPIIYLDRSLNLAVCIGRDEHDKPYVQFNTIAEAQPKIDELSAELRWRREKERTDGPFIGPVVRQ